MIEELEKRQIGKRREKKKENFPPIYHLVTINKLKA